MQEIHTDASIAAVEEQCNKLIRCILQFLSGIRGGCDWKLPKIFRLRLFAEAIREIGCAMFTNTGPQERNHKDLKESEGFTNNHAGRVDLDFRRHSTREAAAKRTLAAAAAAETEAKKERMSMVSIYLRS